ncbi:helix-turn-helix transcriptional regulator [Cohaesibacter celericrescens]|uniref:helix-turn-helix transcriptional regulator n=1 Tax=Cohaesibacter celericrescens TaxID=2067669 RepID=UPI00356AFA24
MKKPSNSVSSFLYASPTASKTASLDLGFGRSCAVWVNQNDHVFYEQLEGHTFSFYVRGGQGVWRVDEKPVHGWPGAICIFPHGQSSEWVISQPLEMVHLYLPDQELRRMYSEWTDRDGRMLDLADITYAPAGDLAQPFAHLHRALGSTNVIGAEEAMLDLIGHVIAQDRFCEHRMARLAGGLAPAVKRRLVDYIEAHLDQSIRLRSLAQIAGLSEYHLQRSFKQSCGVSPNVWIAHRKLERAKAMIRAGGSLVQVADSCGFSSQSHFTRSFRSGMGMTPASYRASAI